ncbi:hypothetical protein [Pseudokineococcus sp. 1T1Z-3]|uniref:hypothetical protein n=1 Tax=Pseudokineococcus sp. 1T1Z-3 TaxID=3132745 RepID=UPI00309B5A44
MISASSRSTSDDDVLRSLDAGPPTPDRSPSTATARADAELARVLLRSRLEGDAVGRPAAPVAPSPRPAGRRRTTRALLATGGLVAATTAGLLVLPPLLGGGDAAYASWTATPDGLSAEERRDAGEECRDTYDDARAEYPQLDDAVAAVAERRGAWVTVVLAGRDGFSAVCTTDASAPFAEGVVGSYGLDETPAPRELRPSGLGMGMTGSGAFSMAVGSAGGEVVGLTYDSAMHGTVEATVSGGYFALWVPGEEMEGWPSRGGVPVQVTYADGTTERVLLTL